MPSTSYSAISVIIPTYNGQELLSKNLPSVFKALRDNDQLVVVDDASTDKTISWLEKEFDLKKIDDLSSAQMKVWDGAFQNKAVRVIQNGHNLRFGASCNRGVALSQGQVVWLLNNDVQPEKEVLKHVLPHFKQTSIFAVGCLELAEAEGQKPGGKAKLWFDRGLFWHSRAPEMTTGASDWVNGGSSFFSHEKWNELGGFDHAYYPAYWEDVDLCYRAKQKGWKVWFEAKAVVHHFHETTNQEVFGNRKINAMSWKNALVFTWKNGSPWQKAQFLLWQPYWQLKHHRSKV